MHVSPEEASATPPLAVDRRRMPDRRTEWRGGRRDSDWINRPPGALARFESARPSPGGRWRTLLHSLHIW